jgi:hypothetical protein
MSRPSNNDWRIAGAMGISPNPTDSAVEETMLQGLGYPLRPISSVPDKDAPPTGDDLVAFGQPMQWMGNWTSGLYYPKGSFVRSGTVTAVATTLTLENPEPVPDPADPATYGLPTFTPSTQTSSSVVTSGQTYVFSQDGWIKELRIWVTELSTTVNYRIIIVNSTDPAAPITQIIEEPVLTEDGWKIIALLNTIITAGTVLTISVDALNSGADTNISGGWRYNGPTQTGAPPFQNWSHDNQRTSFRIDKFDLDGSDRGSELEGVIQNSTISLVQTDNTGNVTTYQVRTVIDQGTYMEYGVTLQTETGGGPAVGSVTTVDFAIPIALPTEYAEEVGGFSAIPSWASSVEASLFFDGVNQGVPTTNAYGTDILFEPAQVSEDWDIVSYTGS